MNIFFFAPKRVIKLSPRQRRWLKWLAIACLIILMIPATEVAMVRLIDPPITMPMSIRWVKSCFNPTYPAAQYHWIPLACVPKDFLSAVYITEDRRFFQHWGFDWGEIERAYDEATISGRPPRGASTITQQCARSVFLWQGRSWFRKGLEAYYTIWMELFLSKHRIFELYVNVIELGDGVYGISAAAQNYYNVPASQLTQEQSALLVAIMPNPKQWNPLHPSASLLKRKETIMNRMDFARFPENFTP